MSEQPREAMETAALQQKLQVLKGKINELVERFGNFPNAQEGYEEEGLTNEDLSTLRELRNLFDDPSVIQLDSGMNFDNGQIRVFEDGSALHREIGLDYERIPEYEGYEFLSADQARKLIQNALEVHQKELQRLQRTVENSQNALEKLK